MELTRHGRPDDVEIGDPNPIAMPIGFKRPKPLAEMIASMVRQAIQTETGDEQESWDEANDFEEDEPASLLNFSKYELQDIPDEIPIPDEPPAIAASPAAPAPDPKTSDPPDPKAVELS